MTNFGFLRAEPLRPSLPTSDFLDASPDRRQAGPSATPMFAKIVNDPCVIRGKATNAYPFGDF